MRLSLDFGNIGTYSVNLPNVTEQNYVDIENYFTPLINASKIKARDAIAMAFIFALSMCPNENPSDLWHHVIYRLYLRKKIGTNPEQSWVRTSGEAFELAVTQLYNPLLAEHGLKMKSVFSKKQKTEALQRMGIADHVGSSKIDVFLEQKNGGRGQLLDGYGLIGGLHFKASLAERVSDDIPASRIMMKEDYLSILVTLDVKSFPPPHGNLVNRGELGTPSSPTDKRRYIEEHGDFDACFSFNTRTSPSRDSTPSGSRIFVVHLRSDTLTDKTSTPQGLFAEESVGYHSKTPKHDDFVQFLLDSIN